MHPRRALLLGLAASGLAPRSMVCQMASGSRSTAAATMNWSAMPQAYGALRWLCCSLSASVAPASSPQRVSALSKSARRVAPGTGAKSRRSALAPASAPPSLSVIVPGSCGFSAGVLAVWNISCRMKLSTSACRSTVLVCHGAPMKFSRTSVSSVSPRRTKRACRP